MRIQGSTGSKYNSERAFTEGYLHVYLLPKEKRSGHLSKFLQKYLKKERGVLSFDEETSWRWIILRGTNVFPEYFYSYIYLVCIILKLFLLYIFQINIYWVFWYFCGCLYILESWIRIGVLIHFTSYYLLFVKTPKKYLISLSKSLDFYVCQLAELQSGVTLSLELTFFC